MTAIAGDSPEEPKTWRPHRRAVSAVLAAVFAFVATPAISHASDLHDAVRTNDNAALEALLEGGAEVDESDYILGTALHAAVSQGSADLAKILIKHNADLEAVSEQQGARAMHLAAAFGEVPMLQLLLDGGADIDSRDDHKRTPLLQAAVFGHAEAVELLLESGADIELKDSRYRWTPLYGATYSGGLEVVKLLVEAGADIEARDLAGRTPLRAAATPISWSVIGNGSLIEYLVAVGADINAKDDNGLTILGWAENRAVSVATYVEIAEVLRRIGATK